MASPRLILITFDVDGTLIRSVGDRANHLHKRAFAHSFLEVFGVNGHCDVLPVGIPSMLLLLDFRLHYGFSNVTTPLLCI